MPESTDRFDAIVLGAGAGGLTVAVGLSGLGRRVALVESGAVGGDCTNVGCIPSKTLLALSRQVARGELAADAALTETRRRRDRLQDEETSWASDLRGVELIRGRGRLAGRGRVEVAVDHGAPRELRARDVVLATGSHPVTPPIPGLEANDGPALLTNESLFELASPPPHLAILGGGAIGCEMATAFARLGSRVTIVEREPRLLPPFEPEAATAVLDALRELGVEVRAGASLLRAEGRSLHVGDGGPPVADVDAVLVAVGRRPNLDDVGLDTVGLEAGPRGLAGNGWGRLAPGLYAVGDAAGSASTHAANAQARRLVRRLAVPILPVGRPPDWPAAVFAAAEVASVGPTREALEARMPADRIVSHRVDLADTDRGLTDDVRRGFVLLHAERLTGRLLSATLVGPAAAETLPLLVELQARRGTLWSLSDRTFAYPTLAEAIRKAADAFVLSTLPALPREAWSWATKRGVPKRGVPNDTRVAASRG